MEELVRPWRKVAERHGFRFLQGRHEKREHIEYLQSGATWLDLTAVAEGFSGAALRTWIDADQGRWSLTTFAVVMPRPHPPGALGFLAARLVVPLMHRLAAEPPLVLRAPEDLRAAIEKHLRELLATAGKPVQLALEDRFEQEKRDATAAPR